MSDSQSVDPEQVLLARRRRMREARRARARVRAWREEGVLLVFAALAGLLLAVWLNGARVPGSWGWGLATAALLYAGSLLWRIAWLARRLPVTVDRKPVMGVPGLIQARQRRQRRAWMRRQRRLIRLLKRYHRSAMSVPDAMVVLRGDREIEWVNDAAGDMLGLKPSDQGLRIDNLLRAPAFVDWLEQGAEQAPLEMPAPGDETRAVSLRIEPYGSERQLLIGRDITALHRLQGVRQDFVANVSHELRTPLTVLAGYVETLLDTDEEVDPQMQRILSNMHQQADRMRRIVEDLLLLSRLETSQPDEELFEEIDVERLLEPILADARLLSGEEGHRIESQVDASLRLRGVPRELQSAFSNLVFNAVKYTPAGGRVRVSWARDDRGRPLFAVSDSGIGIEPRHIPRLTERFYRIDVGRSRSRGGTGLGLAIVKHVALRHGARLKIESTPGKGSCFRVVFPAERATG
jgi:two-component system phosphate regulon sensor histidine kinase PhoR